MAVNEIFGKTMPCQKTELAAGIWWLLSCVYLPERFCKLGD